MCPSRLYRVRAHTPEAGVWLHVAAWWLRVDRYLQAVAHAPDPVRVAAPVKRALLLLVRRLQATSPLSPLEVSGPRPKTRASSVSVHARSGARSCMGRTRECRLALCHRMARSDAHTSAYRALLGLVGPVPCLGTRGTADMRYGQSEVKRERGNAGEG
jgi:hypothetical protein